MRKTYSRAYTSRVATETEHTPRKRSPRAPAFPLKDALDRALKIYEKEGRHPVPSDVAAQDIGYKDGNSGAARTTLATLRQFGLLTSPKEGHVVVTRPVEAFKFAPDEGTRASLLLEFLRTPPIYRSLLNKYQDRLPSDAALRFEFVNLGFLPANVDEEVQTFKKSVAFGGHYEQRATPQIDLNTAVEGTAREGEAVVPSVSADYRPAETLPSTHADRIPIRLGGGRKAILEIPAPFYEADKRIIKAQVDLILTDDAADAVATAAPAQREE